VRLAERAAAALRELPAGADPKAAVQAAAGAAEALAARLAQGTDPGAPEPAAAAVAVAAPADPELGLTPAETAAAEQLARRERQLRERLQTILAERIAPQQNLRAESVALGRALAELRDRAGALSDRARGPAQEAARTLAERAPQAIDQGTDRLAQGQAAAARDALRQAAAQIESGAQQAEDLAAALRTERPPDPASPGGTSGAALATARAAMRQAAEQLAQAQPEAAGQAMQQAARELRAAAERGTGQGTSTAAASSQPAPGSGPESDHADPAETLARPGTPDLSELKAMIARTTGRTWGELPGHLRTEILQMSQGRYRDEYARLIQLYFQEIAAGAGGSPP
jgi:hypothetical protein